MDKNGKPASRNSLEEKKAIFKKRLQEKALKKNPEPGSPVGSPHIRPSKPDDDIPERHYRVTQFPEYVSLKRTETTMQGLDIENPYFKCNEGIVNSTTTINGRRYISYSSYNYLGFSGDARISEAAKNAVDRFGTSASASRIASGERPIHAELENVLADFIGVEACIVFVSGYGTNVSTIGHLLGPKDLIVHDTLIHASAVNGSLLSGAKRIPFPHNDWRALDRILKNNRHAYERVLIIIEGIYSMDGDMADLPKYIELRSRHKTLLMVDEAHSMGVAGKTGRGVGEFFGVDRNDVDIWMGTLSKTFASCGGYIGGSRELIRFLKYASPGFVYSVGMSPPNAAAALAAVRLLRVEQPRIDRLKQNGEFFLELAKEKGFNTGTSADSPIIPIIIGDSLKSLQLSNALFERGIDAQPMLHPAVSENAARLRFFVTSEHTREQMRYTLEQVEEFL